MSLGLPYMGSKRKIAADLIHYMANANPNAVHFYDLFGGGGAMSFTALQSGFFNSVHYSDLNTAVVALLEKIRTDGVTDEFYQWISREQFFELIKGDDWLAGLAQTCWSFGNNQKSYLYGRKIEQVKRDAHDEVMAAGGNAYRNEVLRERRKAGRFQLQHLQALEYLERLQNLERLERLERLGNFERLQITNLDYRSVPIATPPEQTIIYCDIPYQGTTEYKHGGFDHEAFFDWCRQSPYKIYVSSYNAPMNCVYELAHRATLSATANNRVIERLFCNQKESDNGKLF
jgi:site-specific DNA-adenine methylase